ncbi:MAG: tRNA 2-selenouridine(34) synthase MnmH, partial [Syntrophomonadaceae bacterium]|nr:tRNA 2-selenouridine(34) synthase MnmH [Syntrophomonadaceae bacterium]
ESRRIGRNTLPTPLLEGMRAGRHILLYDSLENRIQRLVREYTDMNSTDLTGLSNAVWSLKNRLGTSKTIDLIKHLNQEDFDLVTRELLLSYYDPLYKYPSEPSAEYDLCVETSDIMAAAKRIETFVRERYGE